jgi:tetratricopeptide (TPR) repeat protein
MPKKIDNILNSAERTQSGRITLSLPVKIIAIVVVIAALGVAAYLLFFMPKQASETVDKPADQTTTSTDKITNSKVTAVTKEATNAAYGSGGSTEKGIEVYDKAITNTGSDDTVTLGGLYHDKAKLLLNAGDLDAAFAAALKATETNPSYSSYGILGSIYEQKKDKANAITAYEKAITYLPASSGGKNDKEGEAGGAGQSATRNYYQSRIEALKAGA